MKVGLVASLPMFLCSQLFGGSESSVETVGDIVSDEIETKGHYEKNDCDAEKCEIMFTAHDRLSHFGGYGRGHGTRWFEKRKYYAR
jgi:hypothetical protein